jgi:hypothetical protein
MDTFDAIFWPLEGTEFDVDFVMVVDENPSWNPRISAWIFEAC